MTGREPDYYAVLEVPPQADAATIRAAHKRLVRACHPDVNPGIDPSRIALVNAAFEVLSDPAQRKLYDVRRGKRGRRDTAADDPEVQDTRRRAARQAAQKDLLRQQQTERRAREAAERIKRKVRNEQDAAAAAERLRAHEERMAAERAQDPDRKERLRQQAEQAAAVAARQEQARQARLRQQTRQPIEKPSLTSPAFAMFRSSCWKTLRSPEFLADLGSPRSGSKGRWEALANGLRWQGEGREVVLLMRDLDWALQQLWVRGRISQYALTNRMGSRAEAGKAFFMTLRSLPFFEVRPDPWTLFLNRALWEAK